MTIYLVDIAKKMDSIFEMGLLAREAIGNRGCAWVNDMCAIESVARQTAEILKP